MGSIVMVSDQSTVGVSGFFRFDKLAHFCVFGLLATLILRMLSTERKGLRNGLITALFVSLFGISDEFHQSFTPGRSVEVADWVADTLGAITAVWFYLKWNWYRKLMESGLKKASQQEERLSGTPAPVDREG